MGNPSKFDPHEQPYNAELIPTQQLVHVIYLASLLSSFLLNIGYMSLHSLIRIRY